MLHRVILIFFQVNNLERVGLIYVLMALAVFKQLDSTETKVHFKLQSLQFLLLLTAPVK